MKKNSPLIVHCLVMLLVFCFGPRGYSQTWNFQDIGNVGAAGNSIAASGTFTIQGAGSAIGGTADSFNFTYLPATSNSEIITRVVSQTNTNNPSTVGIMMRETLDAGAKNVMISVTPGAGVIFSCRTAAGGNTATTAGSSSSAPRWLRLTRSGSTFSGFESSDGVTWTLVGQSTFTMADGFDAGLAVCSNSYGTLNSGVFDHASVFSYVPQLSSNLQLWLRADVNLTIGGSNQVSRWQDQSGNGNDATQSVSGNQPVLQTDALNWKPAVYFDGTAKYLNLPNVMSGATAGEIFVVVKAAAEPTSTGRRMLDFSYGGNAYPWSDNQIYEDFGSNTYHAFGVPPQPLTNYNLYNVSSQSGQFVVRINGIKQFLTTTNTVSFASSAIIGRNISYADYFAGNIAEIIVYNQVLSGSDRIGILAYVNQKYGIIPAPTTPSNLYVAQLSPSENVVSWTGDLTNSRIRYVIERKAGTGGTYSLLATVHGTATYMDTSITSGQQYYYRVYAVDAGLTSAYSAEAGVTMPNASGGSLPVSGMQLWLMADGAWENPLGYWKDYSGNGNDAWQYAAGARPTVVTNTLNGKPVVHFDGSAKYLNLPNLMSGATAGELFVVARAAAAPTSTGRRMLDFSYGGNAYPWSDGQMYEDFGSSTYYSFGLPSQSLTDYNLYNVSSQSGEFAVRLNGVQQFLSTTNTVAFATSAIIGRNISYANYFAGDIAEIIVYNRVLSGDERASVLAYINQKYAIIAAPSTPAGLNIEQLSATENLVSWVGQVANSEIDYQIWRSESGGSWSLVATIPGLNTFIDTGLDANGAYTYKILAVNSAGSSAFTSSLGVNRNLPQVKNFPVTGMKLWLMGDGASESPLGYWPDYSGNGNDAWQYAAGARPTVVTNALNGKPVVHFDGSAKYLNLPNLMSGATAGELFVVTRAAVEPTSIGRRMLDFSYGGSAYPWSDNQIYEDFGSNTTHAFGLPPQPLTDYSVYNVSSQSGEFTVRLNEVQLFLSATNTVSFATSAIIGSNINYANYFAGDIAEIIVYNRVLSNEERKTINQYFAMKYLLGAYDPDEDGLTNSQELTSSIDPLNRDMNGDGLLDGIDIALGFDLTNLDLNGDGYTNAQDIAMGIDPFTTYTPPTTPPPDPSDHTLPDITLITPPDAVLLP